MEHQKQQNAVVVGGGIAGLLTAQILAKQGKHVTLVEASTSCGGLLCSRQNEDGVSFDMGAHLLKETGIAELDELLFGSLSEDEWQNLDRLKVGGFFSGKLYEKSQFLNLRDLPKEQRNQAVYDLLSTEPLDQSQLENAESYALKMFGPTIAHDILQPIIEKRYGATMDQLHPSCLLLLGYARFIAFDQCQTEELKKSPFYDQKIGHTTWNYGINPLKNFYPTEQGIQLWVDQLVEKLKAADVDIRTDTFVTATHHSDRRIHALELNNGEKVDADEVYWTITPVGLLKSSGIDLPSNLPPPTFRSTALANFIFDKDFNTDVYYYYNHDPEGLSFRTTFYSNLRKESQTKSPYNCTVEVISDAETIKQENLTDILLSELCEHGVITDQHKVLYQDLITSPNGFPLPTQSFMQDSEALSDFCDEQFTNVVLFGRAGGKDTS